MTARTVVAFITPLLLSAGLAAQDSDLEKLQGDWIWQLIESKGVAKAVPRPSIYTFKGSEYTVTLEGAGKPSGKIPFVLDSSKEPKTIDRTMASGNVLRGIFKLEADTLTICSEGSSGERPTEFKTTEKDWRISVFKRATK